MSVGRNDSSRVQGPLVSVVIPVYNGSRVIVETIRSVLTQTHQNLEVIVVDDGSTDRTLDVLQDEFGGDGRVRVFSQTNSGVAGARNAGLEKARGGLVAFLDADDLWKPEKLAKQVALMSEAGPDVAVVYTWYAQIDEYGIVIPPLRPKPPYRGNVLIPLMLQNFIGNASTPLIRTSAVKRVGGYGTDLLTRSGGQGLEDWHLYLKLAERFDFEVVEAFLTGYRQVPGSMSRAVGPFLANYREARRDVWSRHPNLPPAVRVWSELYLLSWMIDRAQVERRPLTGLRLIGEVARVIGRHPLLPFRAETRAFVRYVREVRRHEEQPSPGAFLDSELVVDSDAWQTALELRRSFLNTVMQ